MTLTQRYRYEFRFFGQHLPTDSSASHYTNLISYDTCKGRARYMVRAIIPINKAKIEKGTAYLNLYNKVFIGIGHNAKPERIFDQNRLFLGLGYKFTPQLRIEAGYLNQFIPRGATAGIREMDKNDVLQVFVILDDLNSLFKKKE